MPLPPVPINGLTFDTGARVASPDIVPFGNTLAGEDARAGFPVVLAGMDGSTDETTVCGLVAVDEIIETLNRFAAPPTDIGPLRVAVGELNPLVTVATLIVVLIEVSFLVSADAC